MPLTNDIKYIASLSSDFDRISIDDIERDTLEELLEAIPVNSEYSFSDWDDYYIAIGRQITWADLITDQWSLGEDVLEHLGEYFIDNFYEGVFDNIIEQKSLTEKTMRGIETDLLNSLEKHIPAKSKFGYNIEDVFHCKNKESIKDIREGLNLTKMRKVAERIYMKLVYLLSFYDMEIFNSYLERFKKTQFKKENIKKPEHILSSNDVLEILLLLDRLSQNMMSPLLKFHSKKMKEIKHFYTDYLTIDFDTPDRKTKLEADPILVFEKLDDLVNEYLLNANIKFFV